MSKQKLVLKYNPAKKEVEFHRFQNDKEIPIKSDSRLMQYMNMKGKFVLQDFGNDLIDDIAKAFDGLKSVDIEVIARKPDYEDFVQMVKGYNVNSVCKMNTTLRAESSANLPYKKVRKEGITMSKQKLVLKYHPAKKEVEFHRFQNGTEVPIRNDSRLMQYMNMKGKFVLQDFGNSLFDDIAKVFDGLKAVDIEVIATRLDYEDFVQMVEYYNVDSACKVNTTLRAELPDMKQTFGEAVKHGQEAVAVLEKHKKKLFEIPLENDNVKKSAENFAQQIDDEIRNIKEKIASLKDNHVSLCFTGVYSAGKSALINAILGYRILPENIKSETAKMFEISSPRDDESVKIIFTITNIYAEIEWNDKARCFEFAKGPSENPIRKEIQVTMNDARGLRQHEQIKNLLCKLNECPEVSPSIQVKFPVSLDSENVQFTIYDTPGADSNYVAHRNVLMDALEEQRQSILIFVAKPDGLEGEGNNALLNYLKEAEGKSKTSIDIGRSFFVINKADGQTAENRKTLQYQEIKAKGDEAFSIKLSDKKLFFTSARYAYAVKAVANGIATPEDKGIMEAGKSLLTIDAVPFSYCYRQNRCAISEVATKRMIETCEIALEMAKKENDSLKELEICTGLYALENEIKIYGEKYASAVKAFAIIDSVDKALSKLSNQADSLRNSNQEEISTIENSIKELRETIESAIDKAYEKTVLPPDEPLPKEIQLELGTDSDTLKGSVIGTTRRYLDRELQGWFFGHGKVRFSNKNKDMVTSKIEQVIDDFTNRFLTKRKELLQKNRDIFKGDIEQAIDDNGRISEAAKKVILDIPEPKIDKPKNIAELGDIYISHKRLDNVLWFKQENLDKAGFLEEIDAKLMAVSGTMIDDYAKDYCAALDILLQQTMGEFRNNLDKYSVQMQAMIENREAMKKLGGRVSDAAASLKQCQELLNKVIWEEL